MLLTICNLTQDPVCGLHAPKATVLNRFSIQHFMSQSCPLVKSSKFIIQPYSDLSTNLPKCCADEITLLPYGEAASNRAELACGPVEGRNNDSVHSPGLQIKVSICATQTWKVVRVVKGFPWRLFLVKVSPTHTKLMIFPRRDTASFLSLMPDHLPLSSLLLPATHDTMSFYGWPISQCQTTALSTQFRDGIRVIDIRLAVIPPPIRGIPPPRIKQNLISYHGVYPEKTPFLSILTDVHSFLTSDAGRSETIVMSIKQEDASKTPPPFFSRMVREFMMNGPGGWDDKISSESSVNRGMWFLENRIPELGEVRGKVILFSRFGGDGAAWPQGLEGIGIHPTTWPDSSREAFEWELKGTCVRTYDWYAIPSLAAIPEKVQNAAANLIPPRDPAKSVLPISFFSGSSFPLALPPTVAKGMMGVEGANSLLGGWLLDQILGIVEETIPVTENKSTTKRTSAQEADMITSLKSSTQTIPGIRQEPRIRGWAFLDFYEEPSGIEVVPLLIECNFLGRKTDEEGW